MEFSLAELCVMVKMRCICIIIKKIYKKKKIKRYYYNSKFNNVRHLYLQMIILLLFLQYIMLIPTTSECN